MVGGRGVPVRRDLPRFAVVTVALAIMLLVAVLAAARTATEPAAEPGTSDLSPAAEDSCRYLDPSGRDLRILFVGDSMTQGRSGSATFRYWTWRGLVSQRRDVTFVGPATSLNGRVGAEAYEHLDHGFADQLQHAAEGGATFESSRSQYPPLRLVRDHRPDVIVLQLGFNDSNRVRTTPEQLAARSRRYVETVWQVAPATRFVIGQVPPAEGQPGKEELTAERNRRTAAANAIVEDQWASSPCRVQVNRLRDGAEPAWDPTTDTYDGSHPGAAGETLMADRMLSALTRVGVLRRDVSVFDPEQTWDPRPEVGIRTLGDGRVRVDWADERDRLSAQSLKLRIGPDDDYRDTPWYSRRSVVLDLAPGPTEIRAIVGRGLPDRMVSEPSAPQEIVVR